MVDTVPEFIDRYFNGDASTIVTVISFNFAPNTKWWELYGAYSHLLQTKD